MEVVEVGFELKNNFKYYDEILKKHDLNNCFNCKTHDIYYANSSLDGLTENQMKNTCVRIRIVNEDNCEVQNTKIFDDLKECQFTSNLQEIECLLELKGFSKVFDTLKKDHHYGNQLMNCKIQLQEIEDVGLLVYYDNSKYYNLPLIEQRNKLIDDLNEYGFNFKYDDLGLDKLRTLYYKKKMYSNNQNG